MKPALIDDRYLSDVLRDTEVPQLEGRDLFTTGYWYVRLCQAVLGGRTTSGVLSGPFANLPEDLFTHERPPLSCSSPVPSVSSASASWLH